MLVQALCLRHLGRKLPVEVLRAAVPMEGDLRLIDSFYGGRDGRGKQLCLLVPQSGEVRTLVELYSARLIRIETRGILIGGEEEVWDRKRVTKYRQTLWAWPVPPPLETSPRQTAGSPEVRRLVEALDAMA